MKHDQNLLQEYLDGLLSPDEGAKLEAHLADCDRCRQALEELRQHDQSLAGTFSPLNPGRVPEAHSALARFHQNTKSTMWTRVKGSIATMNETLNTSRLRWAFFSLALAAAVLIFAAFPAARQAAAQFLAIFRAEQFVAVSLDAAQMERLEAFGDQLDAGLLGEVEMLRKPEEPYAVADVAEASAVAGFPVRVPTALPEQMALAEVLVGLGPQAKVTVERGTVEALLAAAGVEAAALPDFETVTVESDFSLMVAQSYIAESSQVTLMQMHSPTASYSEDIDPSLIGELLLRIIGMPEDEAHSFSQTIDWTTTLVIPVPAETGRYREIEVDGVTGLLMELRRTGGDDEFRPGAVLVWQRGGIIYALSGRDIRSSALLEIANSLD